MKMSNKNEKIRLVFDREEIHVDLNAEELILSYFNLTEIPYLHEVNQFYQD